jgi:FtsH-binding integral membrane protein
MALTALACLAFAVAAVWERRRLVAAGVGETLLASSTARSMALVWAWAALSLLLTYVFVLSWIEWWQYVLGAGAIAGLCLFFASMLSRDAAAGREDQSLLKLARYLTLGQLVGMIIAMVGLVLDDKMPRSHEKPDWAASTIFFFGAASLAVISANALRGAPLQKS